MVLFELFDWLWSLGEAESIAVGLFAVLGAILATIRKLTLDRLDDIEDKQRKLEKRVKALEQR